MLREFHLSAPGIGRGVSCDADGAHIGDVPLLKRSIIDGKEKWEPRECAELSKDICGSLGLPIDMSSKMGGIRAISNALNKGDVARAQIATVLLGIPDPPALSKGADNRAELNKFIDDLFWSGLLKADWDPDEHMRWPAGSPDSQGGRFAPKDEDSTAGQAVNETAPTRASHDIPSDTTISPRERFYPSTVPSVLQIDNEGVGSISDGASEPFANEAEDLGIYASYGPHIGDVHVVSAAAVALDGLSIGAAQPANWANLTRLVGGALRLGSGQVITAGALLAAADIQRERAAVDDAINKFGFDSTKAADVLAIRAYVWAQDWAPMNFAVPWSGPQLEAVSQCIMAIELNKPGTLYLAMQGDAPSRHYLDVAAALGMENGPILESRARPANMPAALQTTSEAARAALGLRANDRMRAHHLIPANVWKVSPITKQVSKLAGKGGWNPDSAINLIELPADAVTQADLIKEGRILPIHNASHQKYDAAAAAQIIEESATYGKGPLTPAQAHAIFEKAAMGMRLRILKQEWWPRLY